MWQGQTVGLFYSPAPASQKQTTAMASSAVVCAPRYVEQLVCVWAG